MEVWLPSVSLRTLILGLFASFIEWTRRLDNSGLLAEANEEQTIYFIPELEDYI